MINGLVVDQVQATQITTGSLTSSGGSIIGNFGINSHSTVNNVACAGPLTCTDMTTSSVMANTATINGALSTQQINLPTNAYVNVNDQARINFFPASTQVNGDLVVTGNVSSSNSGSLSALQGSGLTISGSDITLDHDNWTTLGFNEKAAYSGQWNTTGNFWDGYSMYPAGHVTFYTNTPGAWIEYDMHGNTLLANFTRLSMGICGSRLKGK